MTNAPNKWISTLGEELLRGLDEALERAVARERQLLHNRLILLSTPRSGTSSPQVESIPSGAEWIGIDSLSKLRALVGGRFQQLKQRWTDAGFPLRAHRGDRSGGVEIRADGWLELAAWIERQGYEARQVAEDSSFLFEVRQVNPM